MWILLEYFFTYYLLTIKLNNPVKIVDTLQAGFHVSGWKSDILKQSFLFVLKRPLGVIMYIDGGLKGNSLGKTSFP